MSGKADYEERKATREKMRAARDVLGENDTDLQLMDCLDRMATAFERIAAALEPQIINGLDKVDIT